MNADKHAEMLKAVLAAVKEEGNRKTLSCAQAHRIADELGAEIRAVGEACNREGIRIAACQLGLFP